MIRNSHLHIACVNFLFAFAILFRITSNELLCFLYHFLVMMHDWFYKIDFIYTNYIVLIVSILIL